MAEFWSRRGACFVCAYLGGHPEYNHRQSCVAYHTYQFADLVLTGNHSRMSRPAISRYRQNAFANWIWHGVQHSASPWLSSC